VSACGTGSHIGTHQSLSFYGGEPWQNYSHIIRSQKADEIVEVTGSAFNAFLQDVARARDVVSASDVPVHPWLAPREFVCQDPGTLAAGSWLYGSDYWVEMVYHIALSTAATEFLWWKPGAQKPETVGRELAVETLAELAAVAEVACGGPAVSTKPLADAQTAISGWTDAYVLSGATVTCDSGAKELFRFTPRCLDLRDSDLTTTYCTQAPASLENTTLAEFKIGSGFEMFPAGPDATLLVLPAAASGSGFWVLR